MSSQPRRPAARLSRTVQTRGLLLTFVLAAGAVVLIARGGSRQAERQLDLYLQSAARRTTNMVLQAVAERRRETELLATLPDLLDASARAAGTAALPEADPKLRVFL
ncbi:MAG TPA: hypothetical protein VF454_07190, partial [Gemmatimonadales bacterium]